MDRRETKNIPRKSQEEESRKRRNSRRMGRTGRRNQKSINKKKVKNKTQNVGKKPWWDKDCRNSKMKLNRSLRQMRKGNIERTEFIEEKQRHNKLQNEEGRRERKRADQNRRDTK